MCVSTNPLTSEKHVNPLLSALKLNEDAGIAFRFGLGSQPLNLHVHVHLMSNGQILVKRDCSISLRTYLSINPLTSEKRVSPLLSALKLVEDTETS